MKKLVVVLAALLFVSCNKFSIEGTATGIKDGTKVYLEGSGEMGPMPIDTVEVKDGKFEFEGKSELPEIGFISIDGVIDPQFQTRKMVPLIIEKGSVEVVFNKDEIQKSQISGTTNNDKFAEYNKKADVIYKKLQAFQTANQEAMIAAQKSKDEATIKKLQTQYLAIVDEMDKQSIDFIKNNPDAFLSVLLLENFISRGKLPTSEVKSYFDKLDSSLLATKSAKNTKKMIDAKLKNEKGQQAQDFSAKTPDGKTVSLKQVLGKVTIIDFWASWCEPCRKENPSVVALYNELHAKGLNIIGVSMDDDATKWKEAIAKDKLTWTQVSTLKGFQVDPIAKQYNVNQIPSTFILDAKGNIVAKDLRGDELKAKVVELLSK